MEICKKEGGKCVLFSSCFMFYFQLWGLVNIPVFKAIMNNGKSGRLWHDSEEEEGSTQPTRHRFATIVVGTGSGKRQRYQLKDLKTKEEESTCTELKWLTGFSGKENLVQFSYEGLL